MAKTNNTASKKKSPFPKLPHPAVMAVWAALLAASQMLPAIVLVGTGGNLSVATALTPLCGIFFGPFGGAITAAIGGFIGQIIAPSSAWLGIFTFTVSTAGAFAAGMIAYKRWYYALIIYAVGLAVWFSQEIGRKAWFFAATMFGLGLLMTCIMGPIIQKWNWIASKNPLLKAISLYCTCLAGLLTQGTFAGIFQIMLFKMPVITYKVLMWTAPMERITLAVASTIIGIPLLYALPKLHIYVGPGAQEMDDDTTAVEAMQELNEE